MKGEEEVESVMRGNLDKYIIKCLNIQGLTNEKYSELYGEIGEGVIMCLTETQKKVNNIRIGQEMKILESMREMQDQRGGGIMILYEEREDLFLEKKESRYRDCLEVSGKFGKEKVNLTVVYLKTGAGREELEHNREILARMKEGVLEAEERGEVYIAVGDFNGHLGYLGYQEENENGKNVNKLIEESGLLLMNIDEKCEGVYTWRRGESRSAIDLVLVNEKAFSIIQKMIIDENQEIIDLSDHCLVEVEMATGRKERAQWNEVIEGWFYSKRGEKVEEYMHEVERKILQMESVSMKKINEVIREVADNCLKVRYKRRRNKAEMEEPPWMNREIRSEIAKRRTLNKRFRNRGLDEDRELRWAEYREQKEKVKRMISEEMKKYEKGVAHEIRSMGRGKQMWKMIKKLKGEKIKEEKVKLYTEEGEELEEERYEERMREFWQNIYQMHGNEIDKEWGEEKIEEYEEVLEAMRRREENIAEMWLPRLGNPSWNVRRMKFEVREESIRKILGELRSGKVGGLDGLKPELYKVLLGSEIIVEGLKEGIERIVEEGGEPESWKESRTVMIPKKKRPTVAELRPIALTDVSYKIVMKVVKEEVERHLEENGLVRWEQVGFTKGGEILDNLLVLQECVRQSYGRGEQMVVIAVDFSKAYDSIRREKVVEVLKDLKVPVKVIDMIRRGYVGDRTRVEIGGRELLMEIDSGIRQGCTASPLIFKLITYKIIEELKRRTSGVVVGGVKVSSLFFADDGMLLARGVEEAGRAVRILREEAGKYGLEMNTEKSKCMLFNGRGAGEEVQEIEGVEVVSEVKYLGVMIENKSNLYAGQRRRMIDKGRKMSNLTYSVIEKCCHRVIIGKVYWKSVVLAGVLYGAEVVNMREVDVEKLQRQENVTMRRILRAPKYVAVAAMQGEIGIGTMKSRLVRGRLQYLRRKMQGDNNLVKEVMASMRRNNVGWWKRTEKYLEWAGIEAEELEGMSGQEVKRRIADRVDSEWMEEINKKSTLWLYREYKQEMTEEDYEGGERDRIWFRARTNCLWLGDRRGERWRERCMICGGDELEDLMHFVLDCRELEEERGLALELQRPRAEQRRAVVGEFLFGERNRREKGEVLMRMWRRRQFIEGVEGRE